MSTPSPAPALTKPNGRTSNYGWAHWRKLAEAVTGDE